MAPAKGMRVSIQVTLFSIFLVATSLTAGLAIALQYYFSSEQASRSALNQFQMSAQTTRDYLTAIDNQATEFTNLLASDPRNLESTYLTPEQIALFTKVMEHTPLYYSIFLGKGSGHFSQLINLDSAHSIRKRFKAAPNDRWIYIEISPTNAGAQRVVRYLDDKLQERVSFSEPHSFDPRQRPWYLGAQQQAVYKSSPYQFTSLNAPGLTYSKRFEGTDTVLGLDIALTSLSGYLANQSVATASQVYLYQNSGEVIATNQTSSISSAVDHQLTAPKLTLSQAELELVAQTPVLRIANSMDWSPIDFSLSGKPKGYAIDMLNLISQMTGLRIEYVNGYTWPQLVDQFKNGQLDALQAVYHNNENLALGALSEPFVSLPFAVVTNNAYQDITHINQLNNKTLAITEGWSITEQLKTAFPQINIIELATIRDVFDAVATGKAHAGLDTKVALQQTKSQFFIDGVRVQNRLSFDPIPFPETLHLMLQTKHQNLLPVINKALDAITPAQRDILYDKWIAVQNTDVTAQNTFVVPNKVLLNAISNKSIHNKLIEDSGNFVFISPVNVSSSHPSYFAVVTSSEQVLSSSLADIKISIMLTAACLLCMLPLSYFFAVPIVGPIKRLMAQNENIRLRRFDDVVITPSHIKEIDQLALSLTNMSSAIQAHELRQSQLMESFIELIAQAIDDKSHYTAGHCERVPEIGTMLADAASNASYGSFKDFSFTTEEQKREFRIAAWLHDCGKITTPEHIVDKATKLETIYNRIHEIRMRFEVLWRDAQIDYHKQLLLAPESGQFYKSELQRKLAQLQADFAFVAECNLGGEFISDDKIARLKQIAAQTWQRHFDDRMGLSEVELANYRSASEALPVTEQLLMDKDEHKQTREQPLIFPEKFGIKMHIPELAANKGELYNLSIGRGTLSSEDRFKINEHIISTIKMLDSLPFPPELANVPRWASTHHETLIGTGYPRQLTREELSVPERILVLADIFEALTASDRPYKKAKPLSVAIDIMHKMVQDQHIDKEVFELFLSSGVYLTYAKKYLPSDQLDSVDINKYLTKDKVA